MDTVEPKADRDAAEADMNNPSGLHKLRAAITGDYAPSGFDTSLRIKVEEAERGKVVLAIPALSDYANAAGVMHGGWIAGLLDTASGAAVQSILPSGETYTTLALQVNYLRALPTEGTVRAEGRIVRAGGRVVTAEASVTVGGKAFAIATATCLRLAE